MDRTIKYLLLQKQELGYEVNIRGGVPAENVLELRRQVTKLTQKFAASDILESCLDFNDESLEINDTISKIKTNLALLKTDYQISLYSRTHALLNHVYFRVHRAVPASADDMALQDKMKKIVEGLEFQFLDLSKAATAVDYETYAEHDPKPVLTERPTHISVTCDRGVTSELAKFKYDGKTCVRSFIQRIEEFREAKDIPNGKMLVSATEIFTGDALHWFRSVKERVSSWKMLLSVLKEDFDCIDYDYKMLAEIRNRTQGDSESIAIYLAIMDGMFRRLTNHMNESERLEIILHNIRPCYANILATCPDIDSIESLRILCKNYEHVKSRCDNFKEPPNASAMTLAPEFAYKSAKEHNKNLVRSNYSYSSKPTLKTNNFATSNRQYFEGNRVQTDNRTYAIANSKKFCFRCRVDTHSMPECNADRNDIFCFKCGMKNVKLPDCPNCNPKPSTSKNE